MRSAALVLLAAVVVAACGRSGSPEPDAASPSPSAAHPSAPHGGEVLELGSGEYHVEMIHDHDGGNVTVYVLGADLKTAVAVEQPVVNLVTKEGPVQIFLTAVDPRPDGKAEAWKGSHAGLKADPWDGRVRLRIGGRMYQSPLEGPAHSHE